ncbi:MAG: HipA domain-containing protein [Elusimicrobia bacterium]|nr:HipA domain-containing protein [Elusimicrobiota bacterium]
MKCLSCHDEVNSKDIYHKKCLRNLFGVIWVPSIDFGIADLPAQVSKNAGKMSISGVQIKASIKLNLENKKLEVASKDGTHILKPEPNEYPELPQNENLCMNMAKALKMNVPPHSLFRMSDGKFCYLIKRFDRLDGDKIHNEDMAQILNFSTDAKYSGSLEAVGNVIKATSANSYLDLFDFFQRIIFNFTIGNGDMHLKNWSMLTPESGLNSIAPCYDFVSSKIYLPNEEESSLSLLGKKNKLKRKDFEDFAEYLDLDSKVAKNAMNSITEFKPTFLLMIKNSLLSSTYQKQLAEIILERIERLKI